MCRPRLCRDGECGSLSSCCSPKMARSQIIFRQGSIHVTCVRALHACAGAILELGGRRESNFGGEGSPCIFSLYTLHRRSFAFPYLVFSTTTSIGLLLLRTELSATHSTQLSDTRGWLAALQKLHHRPSGIPAPSRLPCLSAHQSDEQQAR
jgi:hypothetical protein